MLREYAIYPWHLEGPEEFYPSELDAVIADANELAKAMQKARAA